FLRNLRKNYPEIYSAIATRQAIRTLLNYERYTIERLHKNGRIEKGEAQKIISDIEEKMKKLMDSPPIVRIPDTLSLLKESELFKELDVHIFENIIPLLQNRVFPVDDKIIRENTIGDGLYFIARGTVRISIKNKAIDILGRGQFIGEISDMTGVVRSAEVVAESPVTALFISGVHLKKLMKDFPVIKNRLWNIVGQRISENLLREIEPYDHWKHDQLKNLVNKGALLQPEEYDAVSYKEKILILVSGQAGFSQGKEKHIAPALLENSDYSFSSDALLWVC
ncbi:MAG: cyclic nucleotide-binding domain-containing protein, partial [Bacteroidota bacterium]|nr:cyclic nucleotide-binding domain-containing protein [Bacteroidota bacterium]